MAHELEFKQGIASMFTVRESAWHRHGHVIAEAPSFDAGMELGQLNYLVDKRPTQYPITLADGSPGFQDSRKAFVTVRVDTGRELGAVGPDYQPVQNIDAFRVFEPLLDKGVLTLETGGVLREGADAWLMGKWDLTKFGPITREVFGSEVVPYALLATNHTGKRGVLVQKTNIRVVCANTLGFAEDAQEQRVIVRHSGEAQQRLIEAAESLFLNFIEEYEVLSLQYQAMKETFLSEADFQRLVLATVAPDPRKHKRWNPEARMAEAVVVRHAAKVQEVTRLWTEGAGHVGNHSAWEAYNGAVEALDHDEALWPSRGGVYRTQKLLDGELGRMKHKVLHDLVAVSVEN